MDWHYYNAREGLNPETCRLVTFIKDYFNAYEDQIRDGKPPAFGDDEYNNFCRGFKQDRDWAEIALTAYPKIVNKP